MDAIERAIEAEASCVDILNLAASVRGATNGLVIELLEDHLRNHVIDAESGALRTSGAAELIEVMRRHLK
jgi:DNA-binding FrmR family transcriptional regulator